MPIPGRRHPLTQRRHLSHGEIAPAEPAAVGALLAHKVQPFRLWRVLVHGEVGDGGGHLEEHVAAGAVFFEAEVFGAAADVQYLILYRSVGEEAGQHVFHGLEVFGREILIEQEEKDQGHLKTGILIRAEYVYKVQSLLEWGLEIV